MTPDDNSRQSPSVMYEEVLAGRIYIEQGAVTGSRNADYSESYLEGLPGYSLGTALEGGRDLSGDGLVDLVVGARVAYEVPGIIITGAVWMQCRIPEGAVNYLDESCAVIWGEQEGEFFGAAVGSTPDLTGDGLPDLLVGAPRHDGLYASSGMLLIFSGWLEGEYVPEDAQITISGEEADAQLGMVFSAEADFNGDRRADLVVYDTSFDASGCRSGRFLIFLGPLSGDYLASDADVVIDSSDADDPYTIQLSTAGDVNGDGFSDMLIGAKSDSYCSSESSEEYRGKVFLLYGPLLESGDAAELADVRFEGGSNQDHAGSAVSIQGDLNHDGYSDVVVGAEDAGSSLKDSGAVHILWGPLSGSDYFLDDADVIFYGAEENENLGSHIQSHCDLNGDAMDDLVIGAVGSGDSLDNPGETYIFFGGSPSSP